LALVASAYAHDDASSEWVSVFGGWMMHKSCIYEIPEGVKLNVEEDLKTRVCKYPAQLRAPDAQVYAMDTEEPIPGGVATAMNTSWNVPSLPVTQGSQVVYFWPGFKSQQPVMGYPVLQPVLQYGQNGKRSWELQSWFVWGNKGISYTGPAIAVNVGDVLGSYMEYQAATKDWVCYGIDINTGKSSTLDATAVQTDGTTYNYAMLVLETIMPSTACNYYPANGNTGVTFTGVKVNGATPNWVKQIAMTECSQTITSTSGDKVQFTWTS